MIYYLVPLCLIFSIQFAVANPFEKLESQIQVLREEIQAAIPVGTILPYSGRRTIPSDYLPCDGRSLQIDDANFKKLFEVIEYTFTPQSEIGTNYFRIPDLRGRTITGAAGKSTVIGNQENGLPLTARCFGATFGSECHTLTLSQIPRHTHSGITEKQDHDHSHYGTTKEDYPDHSHVSHSKKLDPHSPAKFQGFGYDVHSSQAFQNFSTEGASNHHRHDFSTSIQSSDHEHPFKTNYGDSLKEIPDSLSIASPSIVLRYMIKFR